MRLIEARLAFIISAVTSPFVMTAVTGALLVWALRPSMDELLQWGGIVVTCSAVVPAAVVYALWRMGKVTDVHVAVREQRTIPFIAAITSATVGLVLLHVVAAPKQLVALGAGFVVNGIVLAFITLRWKISIHVAVVTACVVAVGLVVSPQALWGLVSLPVVLWARLYRGKHTVLQTSVPAVLVGALTTAVYLAMMHAMGR